MLRTHDRDAPPGAHRRAGITSTPSAPTGSSPTPKPSPVGTIAFAAGVPLLELRPADGAGLEEMFLELTAETQREGTA